ncbi:hypothetical protein V8E51_010969 [Hyaloscypha variabilis]
MGATLKLKDNPTQEQRKVYKFFKSRQSHDADDIYSREWFDRIVQFQESKPIGREIVGNFSSEMLDTLEFGAFFLSYPVPAFSLWLLLNACYDLDRKICSDISEDSLQEWRDMKPFVYLKSEEIQLKWKESLATLREKIRTDELGGERLIQELYDMVSGIQRMETALTDLRDSIQAIKGHRDRKAKDFLTGISDLVGVAIDKRCEIIAAELEDGKSLRSPRNGEKGSHNVGSKALLEKELTDLSCIPDNTSQPTVTYPSPWLPQELGIALLVIVAWTAIWSAGT